MFSLICFSIVDTFIAIATSTALILQDNSGSFNHSLFCFRFSNCLANSEREGSFCLSCKTSLV
ncbi:MAG: hypothetical protein LBC61_00235 [Candidatus Peribacteria bacterium]|nr:hypothetical protein [Candidatus Peribacteria bacterium]